VIVGAVVGVVPVTATSTTYREASTQRVLLVADDPNLLFEAQEITGGTAFTANDIGLNCNIVVAAGSTVHRPVRNRPRQLDRGHHQHP
jgi:hypothetical protein